MDYKLAKELKDAGFPQLLGTAFIHPDGRITKGNETMVSKSGMASVPTLEELIHNNPPS